MDVLLFFTIGLHTILNIVDLIYVNNVNNEGGNFLTRSKDYHIDLKLMS